MDIKWIFLGTLILAAPVVSSLAKADEYSPLENQVAIGVTQQFTAPSHGGVKTVQTASSPSARADAMIATSSLPPKIAGASTGTNRAAGLTLNTRRQAPSVVTTALATVGKAPGNKTALATTKTK